MVFLDNYLFFLKKLREKLKVETFGEEYLSGAKDMFEALHEDAQATITFKFIGIKFEEFKEYFESNEKHGVLDDMSKDEWFFHQAFSCAELIYRERYKRDMLSYQLMLQQYRSQIDELKEHNAKLTEGITAIMRMQGN